MKSAKEKLSNESSIISKQAFIKIIVKIEILTVDFLSSATQITLTSRKVLFYYIFVFIIFFYLMDFLSESQILSTIF
jgi:hypothetical protein